MSECKYEALSATPLGSRDVFVFPFYRHVTTLWSRKRVILTPEESHVYSNKSLPLTSTSFRFAKEKKVVNWEELKHGIFEKRRK